MNRILSIQFVLLLLSLIFSTENNLLTSTLGCFHDKFKPTPILTSEPLSIKFDDYLQMFSVSVSPPNREFRKFVFEVNLKTINTHNQNPLRKYDMGLNKFTIFEEL